MGLETAPQRALQVPMGPLVTPADPNASNASMIGDAMRKGFITAEEVVDRIGARAKAKEAADIAQARAAVPVAGAQAMAAQEAVSPQAQAMRAQQQRNAMDADQMKMKALMYDVMSKQNQLEPKMALLLKAGVQPPVFGPEGPSAEDIATINRLTGDVIAYEQSVGPAREIKEKHFSPRIEDTTRIVNGKEELWKVPVYDTPLGTLDADQFKNAVRHGSQNFTTFMASPKPSAQEAIFGKPGQVSGAPGAVSSTPPTGQPAAKAVVEPKSVTVPIPFPGGAFSSTVVIPEEAPTTPQVTPQVTPQATPAGLVEPARPPGARLASVKEVPASQKAATDLQARGGMMVAKTVSAEEVFTNLEAAGYNPASVGNYVQDLLVGPLKFFQTDEKQSWDAAEANWMAGLLRLESGAAISKDEKTWYKKAFFPEAGNSQAVRDQKARARQDVAAVAEELARTGNLDVLKLMEAKRKVAPYTPPRPGAGTATISQKGKNYRLVTLPNGMKKYQLAN